MEDAKIEKMLLHFSGLTTINPRSIELDEIKQAASIKAMQQVHM